MKDEMHIYCMTEGIDETYLRAQIKADKRLSSTRKKRSKKPRYIVNGSIEGIKKSKER